VDPSDIQVQSQCGSKGDLRLDITGETDQNSSTRPDREMLSIKSGHRYIVLGGWLFKTYDMMKMLTLPLSSVNFRDVINWSV